ncbi:helix-turn-helix transcriptional regulator [Flavobacterium sp. ANB]|uniref:helix-turn-helix domain-containing protein n=1 Tax=unclassified Flavobacterium TaxID=196869 RepID=UPI0012B6E79E|nr:MULTISPECIES: response regulator transcription factor [unclassified Flavobacterium]MBF4518246.1 helix-turn-helix transcriptional regulator [Flavobacterium sp. ANB]MTD71056.1 helix-turn-helix domain-containing protein [Flavobacterium sp. LC2016-13]
MANHQPYRIKSISEFHEFRDLPKPEHPLVAVYNFEDLKRLNEDEPKSLMLDFYSIALKRSPNAKMRYGQQEYDFNEGVLMFISPGQVFSIEGNAELQHTGWSLLIHPDFLWNTPLAKKIKQYEYFGYSVYEALHLSAKEEKLLIGIMQNIRQEYQSNIDKFSQDVIIAQIELLLTYAERFYNRQFITRKISNHKILERLEILLETYFSSESLSKKGLPTVQYIAENLNVSPNYLSGILKSLTGQSTQQHIHDKLIDKAKEKLSTTNLSISEIAFELGFEHHQSFSKLFKTKTNVSPLEFRQSFN